MFYIEAILKYKRKETIRLLFFFFSSKEPDTLDENRPAMQMLFEQNNRMFLCKTCYIVVVVVVLILLQVNLSNSNLIRVID